MDDGQKCWRSFSTRAAVKRRQTNSYFQCVKGRIVNVNFSRSDEAVEKAGGQIMLFLGGSNGHSHWVFRCFRRCLVEIRRGLASGCLGGLLLN